MSQTLSGDGFDPVTVSWGYDAAGRQTSQVDGLARATSFTLDALGRTIETTLNDPDGPAGPLLPPEFATSFDALGRPASYTDALGNVTLVSHSNYGRTVTTTLADPDGPSSTLTSPVYVQNLDLLGQLVSETDALGRVTLYSHDMLGRVVSMTRPDPDGPSNPLTAPVTQYVFDPASNLIEEIDPLGHSVLYTYDARHRLVEIEREDPDGAGGPLAAPVWQFTFDAASQLISEEDPLGRVTSHVWDGLGREIETEFPDPDGALGPLLAPSYQRSFDAVGRMFSSTDALGNVTLYELDLLDNVVEITAPDPDGPALPLLSPVWQFSFDAASQLVSETDPLGRLTTHQHDNLGRRTKTVAPDPDGAAGPLLASETKWTYDANSNLLTTVDGLLHTTSFGYDNLSRRTTITDAEGGITRFAFDAVSNLISLKDPVNNTTTWTVDNLDRVIQETSALGASRYFVFDAADNLTKKTDRNGRVTEYQHDALDRQTAEIWKNGTATVNTIAYTFDAASQLVSASDPDSEYAFVYDGLGQVTQETQILAGLTPEIVLAKTWDANGNRLSLAATVGDDADFINNYSFDALDRVTQVIQQGQSGGNSVAVKRVDLAYNAAGQFTALDRYQSSDTSEFVAQTAFDFDGMGRLSSLYHTQNTTTLAGYDYAYDATSRITEIDSVTDGLSTFSYDATSQLTAADHTGQSDEAYDFDDNGNRNSSGFTVGTNNRITTDGTYNYEYDDEGNRTKRTHIASGNYEVYAWDYRNRLTKITFKNSSHSVLKVVEHSYDFANRWIRRTVDPDGPGSQTAIETFFAGYDGINPTLQFDGDAASDLDHRYTWGEMVDQLFAAENVDSLTEAGDVLWSFLDHLGTARDLGAYNSSTNETSIANHRVYNAFGSLTSETNSAIDLLFGFTGKPLDESTGLQNNLNRWYDFVLYVWMSEDPIGFAAGDANLARYVGNSPLNKIDPDGLAEEWWNSSGWWYVNPWAYNFPFGQRGIINLATGGWDAIDQGAEMERTERAAARLRAYNDPKYDEARQAALRQSYCLGQNEAARGARNVELGITANAAILGGAAIRPSGAGAGGGIVRTAGSSDLARAARPSLPRFVSGRTTSGVLRTGTGDVPLQSGRAGPASSIPRGTSGFDAYTRTHVEGHAAAYMRQHAIDTATVYINNPTICPNCSKLLERMLPTGATLNVVLPDGSVVVFTGR